MCPVEEKYNVWPSLVIKGASSSPWVLILGPKFTGLFQFPSPSSWLFQISVPPNPPGWLEAKNIVLPSQLIVAWDSQLSLFKKPCKGLSSLGFPSLKAPSQRSQPLRESILLQAVKNNFLL